MTAAPAYRTPHFTRDDWQRCAYTTCRATEDVHPYPCGPRCPRHSPAALDGQGATMTATERSGR